MGPLISDSEEIAWDFLFHSFRFSFFVGFSWRHKRPKDCLQRKHVFLHKDKRVWCLVKKKKVCSDLQMTERFSSGQMGPFCSRCYVSFLYEKVKSVILLQILCKPKNVCLKGGGGGWCLCLRWLSVNQEDVWPNLEIKSCSLTLSACCYFLT